jgi:hypothetical protein
MFFAEFDWTTSTAYVGGREVTIDSANTVLVPGWNTLFGRDLPMQ